MPVISRTTATIMTTPKRAPAALQPAQQLAAPDILGFGICSISIAPNYTTPTSARWKGFVRNSRHRNILSPVLQKVGVELQLDKDLRERVPENIRALVPNTLISACPSPPQAIQGRYAGVQSEPRQVWRVGSRLGCFPTRMD